MYELRSACMGKTALASIWGTGGVPPRQHSHFKGETKRRRLGLPVFEGKVV